MTPRRRIAKFFIIIGTALAALFLEWLIGVRGVFGFGVPLFLPVFLWWLWEAPPLARFAIAGIAGFFLDTILPYPFGVHTLVFVILAGIMDVLQRIVSSVEARMVRFVSIAALFLAGIVLILLVGFLVERFG